MLNRFIRFQLDQRAQVTLKIEDKIPRTSLVEKFNGVTWQSLNQQLDGLVLFPGDYQVPITAAGDLSSVGDHPFRLHASAVSSNSNIAGASSDANGIISHRIVKNEAYPIAHTMVKGVDLWDGHLTMQHEDVTIPGRGLSLSLTRSYSSSGNSTDGPLGAGWTHSYNIQLKPNGIGRYTVVGGEGSGNTFSPAIPNTNPTLATQFGLPLSTRFYSPGLGFHSTLAELPTGEFIFYTKNHTAYRFTTAPSPPQITTLSYQGHFLLRSIEDPNGNRISLYYGIDDLGVTSLPSELQTHLRKTGDPNTVKVVMDSTGRALLFDYEDIVGQQRITKVTGYDPISQSHDLEGLVLEYHYDEPDPNSPPGSPPPLPQGALTSVTRLQKRGNQLTALRTQRYAYTPDEIESGLNLREYIDPNGHATTYTYYDISTLQVPSNFALGMSGNLLAANGFLNVLPNEVVSSIVEPGGDSSRNTTESETRFI